MDYSTFPPPSPQIVISMLLGAGNVPTQSLKVQNSTAGPLTAVGITLVISSLLPTTFSQPADGRLLKGHKGSKLYFG